jgi:YidC/Oxa1 family membrane protein insertase
MLELFGAQDRYFAHILFNDQNHFVQRGYYKVGTSTISAIVQGPIVKKQSSWNLSFYVGPKEHTALSAVDPRLEVLMDYGWLGFICKPMLALMKWINNYVQNFGIAIIILTILIRLLMIPMTFRSSELQKKTEELQKKLVHIKQKYKNDPEAYAREQAELYKKYGLGSLGGLSSGCLPLFVQGPVFFAMNRVLTSSIELYKVPFLWIPDLSAADPESIMPVFVALSMWVSTLAIPNAQQRLPMYIMAIVMGAFSIGFSSGLALYFTASGLCGVAQMYVQKLF